MKRRKCAAVVAMTAAVLTGAGAAAAGPVDDGAPAGLERFYQQQPQWKSCGVDTLDAAGAECADITVPLNYAEPHGKTITVAISRLRATDPAQRRGIMMSNPGGPGGPGLDFALDFRDAMTSDVRARYDLIGMDPRGVGRSAPVDCAWPIGFGLQSAGVDAVSYAKSVATHADLAARCVVADHDTLPYITTRNTARDMDVIRGILGEDKVSYYGTSYGTYLGSVFTQMFPGRADRIVLDSAVDPQRYGIGMMQDMAAPNEAAFDVWADWTAGRDDQYHLGGTGAQVRALVTDLIRQAAHDPIRIGSYQVDDHWLPVLLFGDLDLPAHYGVLADNIGQLADAAAGKPVQPNAKLDDDLAHIFAPPPPGGYGQDAVICGDAAAPRDPSWYWRNIEASRVVAPIFGPFANNITNCAFWPAPVEAPTDVHNAVPALILQSTGDTRTAYQEGVALHRLMSESRLVTLQNVAVHGLFGRYPSSCVSNTVNTYFRDGTLPAADTACAAD